MKFILLLLSLLFDESKSAVFPVVSTKYGPIQGYEYTSPAGYTAQIFKKLPYARPPLGQMRWRKPELPDRWNQTIDGTFFGPACAQRTVFWAGPATGVSEDCLHINVYTSNACRKSNSACPVLFILHGGLAIFESPLRFTDDALVDNFVSQGLVVVSAAYRLGSFGVMALGDENVLPANLALHDVVAALKFTRSVIHSFGGDKDRITILGHSTGAQMTLLLALSPAISPPGENRLFHSIIAMSGPGRLETEQRQIERSHLVANKLGCDGSATEIIECMRTKSMNEILNVTNYGPSSEEGPLSITKAGELLPIRSVKEIYESRQPVRLMIGTTLFEFPAPGDENKVNVVMGIENDEECFEKYTKDRQSGYFVPGYNTDSQSIIMTTHLFAKSRAENGGKVYLYEYDYPEHAKHTQDASFLLGFYPFKKDENEQWLSRVYPRYFANFAKGERPAPDWYQLKPKQMNYYSVNKNETSGESPQMKKGYQDNITKYYEEMMEYDRQLTIERRKVLSAPIEYH
ncbi:hypothetical protein PFISCL1PPCAC_3034 [Pristionchus fissidentatus]|uniref:Carboxylic ester hydrolase n=1 Tax=Pristionchus fissidentatus TaxID=1538716 RepID=A0AAV5UWU5_9BILA|nr:hypothetical protein PFISCL1PPCAC_3034 [Pristionchus fissidentatus]